MIFKNHHIAIEPPCHFRESRFRIVMIKYRGVDVTLRIISYCLEYASGIKNF